MPEQVNVIPAQSQRPRASATDLTHPYAKASGCGHAQVYTVSAPPSDNALRGVYRGRIIKTKVYRQWIAATTGLITWQRLKAGYPKTPISGPCALHMDVGYNSRRDLGNYAKAIGDILQQARVVLNDKQFHSIHLDWAEGVEGVRIEVWPMVPSC